VQIPYMRDWHFEVLVSRKGVKSDLRSEGSETTKVGSNEDQVDIDGKNRHLPGEISETKEFVRSQPRSYY